MSSLLLALIAVVQSGDLDSKDPALARKAFEDAVAAADEKALEEAVKKSPRAKLALAEVRAHKRFGECYPPIRLVTFSAKDELIPNVVADVSKAVSIPIEPYGGQHGPKASEAVTLELDHAYPLEAVDRLLNAVNGQGWYRGNRVEYSYGWTRRNPHHLHWRHVSFFPWKFENERWIDAAGQSGRSFALTLVFRHDGLSRIAGILPLRAVEAVDDRNVALVPEPPTTEAMYHGWFGQANLQLRLSAPGGNVEKLAKVSGILPVLIPEKRTWKEIPLAAGRAELTFTNLKVTVDGLVPAGGPIRVTFAAIDYKKPFVIPDARDFELEAAGGRRIQPARAKWIGNDTVLEVAFDPPADFAGATLRVGSFDSFGEHEIPFEFRDLRIR
jgi:hypothetical protein